MPITTEALLLAARHHTVTGTLKGDQGNRLVIAWKAIKNRQAAQIAYEDHLREMAWDALQAVGVKTPHSDLEALEDEIVNALGVRL